MNPYINFTENRRLGLAERNGLHVRPHVVSKFKLHKRLYRDILRRPESSGATLWNNESDTDSGGIFNIDFNPDSTLLGAACERKCVLLFDPRSKKQTSIVRQAHEDCVNCIRFLDNRLFATCSDDTTVALWDARFLKKKIRSMRGHSNWVKNIEYSAKNNYLVTSGFDGAVYAWDINKFTERNEASKIFYTGGLMRMRLTASSDKMVISTVNGYLIIIHDLCLDNLAADLTGFKPNMYRLLQWSGDPLRVALNSTPLFHAKRNRVELVSDFAPGHDPEVVSSLQLHPMGWVAASRNVSPDPSRNANAERSTEWCCVHDIQSYPVNPDDDQPVSEKRSERPHNTSRDGLMLLAELLQSRSSGLRQPEQLEHPDEVLRQPIIPPISRAVDAAIMPPNNGLAEFHVRNREANHETDRFNEFLDFLNRIASRRDPVSNAEDLEQPVAGPSRQRRSPPRNDTDSDQEDPDSNDDEEETPPSSQGFLLIPPDPVSGSRPRVFSFRTQRSPRRRPRPQRPESPLPENARIHHNVKRLTHFIQESNSDQGHGFIKELSFSPDGLVIASPFDCGVRLLAFNESLEDLSFCSPANFGDAPKELHIVGSIKDCHKEVVLSSAFSPHGYSLVTGCRGGSLVWHQPTL